MARDCNGLLPRSKRLRVEAFSRDGTMTRIHDLIGCSYEEAWMLNWSAPIIISIHL